MLGCPGTIMVKVDYSPTMAKENLLASIPPVKVKLLNIDDRREGKVAPILVGHREAAFGVSMGKVYSEHPVFEIVYKAIQSEFVSRGHSIVTEKEDFTIKGEIHNFWVKTDTTPLYWDVIREISIVLEVIKPGSASGVVLGPYSARRVERTYLNPSEAIMNRLLGGSLNSVIQEMSSDPRLVAELEKIRRNNSPVELTT
jgi:uncharacterized lipoprotein YajG